METISREEFERRYGSGSTPPAPKEVGFLGGVKQAIETRATNLAERFDDPNQGFLSDAVQTLGAGAGLAGDILFEGAKAITPEPVEDLVASGVGAIASTAPVQEGINKYDAWKTLHPEAAANLESIVNIGSLIPALKGGQVATSAAGKGAQKVGQATANTASTLAGKAVTAAKGRPVASFDEALELTAPVLNKKASIAAFERAGKPGGVTTKPGIIPKMEYVPTDFDKRIAETAAPYISKSKNPAQNAYSLGREADRFSEMEVSPFLDANPRAVNVKTVASRLKEIPIPDLFKADPILQRTYELVRQRMIKRVAESGGTTKGLWEARKKFDEDALREFGDMVFDDPKGIPARRAINDMRKGVNDLIGELIGDDTFANQLKRLSSLYEARFRIAETNYKLLNSSKFRQWEAQNPGKARLIKWGLGTGLAGLAGNVVLGI